MKRLPALFLLVILLVPLISAEASGLAFELKKSRTGVPAVSDELVVSVRLVGGTGAVLEPGRNISITFQANKDAYLVLYNIDSEGYVHLLYPNDGTPVKVQKNKVYFLPEAGSGVYWEVGDKTGIEYIHALAVSDRDMIKEEELYFLAQSRKLTDDKRLHVDMDPFLAFNMIDGEILTDPERGAPATAYTYFYVNRKVEYPRYLCAKCHGADKISDPYAMECPEIVIEKAAYEEDLRYPYPEVYQVRHVGEADEEEEDYYLSSDYARSSVDEWDEEDSGTDVHLSIYYSDYNYPYRFYYPHYRYFAAYHYPFYWDWWWWDYGWSFSWADYYYFRWPFYSWYGPYYYWTYYNWHPYRWHYWDRCCYAYQYRNIRHDRGFAKRTLSYASTVSRIKRKEAVAASRVMQKRIDTASRSAVDRTRLGKSRLADQARRREVSTAGTRLRSRQTPLRDRQVERRIVYGRDDRRSRDADGARSAIRQRGSRTGREGADSAVRRDGERSMRRGQSERRVVGPRPGRRSRDDRSVRTPATRRQDSPANRSSGSVRKSSGSSKQRSSSTRTSVDRRSSSSSSSSPARSSSGRSGSSSGSRSSGGGSKTRKR